MVWVLFACVSLLPESGRSEGEIEKISASKREACPRNDFSCAEDCEIVEESNESEHHISQKVILHRFVYENLLLKHNTNTHCKMSRLNQSVMKHNIATILQICQSTVILQV